MKQGRILSAIAACVLTTGAYAQQLGELGIFVERTGWIGQAVAAQHSDAILKDQKTFAKAATYSDKAIGDWAKAKTGDGKIDLLLMWGDYASSLYTPGNAQANGSVGEEFLDDGNFILNTADYIFYVNNGAGANGDTGLKNMTDSTFDMWTDGNVNKPTADGKKFAPSLKDFSAPRSFKRAQVEADGNWEIEVVLADNGGANLDPAVIKHKTTGGRVGILIQVPDDAQPRGAVLTEFINNWVKTIGSAQAVNARGKATVAWGEMKKAAQF